jgi:hypothetical protein
MTTPTHVITTIEPVNLAELAKEQARKNAKVKIEIAKETFEKLYSYLELIFKTSQDKPKDLINLMEAAKDLECYAISGNVMAFLENNYPEEWNKYITGANYDTKNI